ncbi:hypothetical protein ASZ90_007689 [hydrocarbon metagenome]|uniref:Uncharacterized protein n=1 Tax=hydrocarbon metagenome TaxID=938273 RepID=A0A0W8FNQ8_9ZZZZ
MYTVTYNSQGGTDVADQHVTAPATTVGTLPTNPTRTGYTFGGWYTEEEGGGTQFTATTTVTEDITVYAKWDSYSGPVSIGGTSYATLQAAYVAANNGDTIKVKAVNITENINVNRDIWVNIEGGYDDNYSSIIGNTTLQGMIQTFAGGGTLTIKNFILQRGSYDILATAGVNGSITPSGLTNVVTGNNQTFTITPYSGYSVHAVLVDGDSVGAVPSSEFSYEFSNVATEHTIHAIFNCKITATAGSNGSITPSGTTSVGYGGSQIYTITPDSGYIVQDVLVDGISVGDGTVYPFNNVTNDHTISVSFTPLTKLLLHMDGTNGSTTFIDSSPGAKTITPHGNAQLSTAQKKFGTASGLFDGDSDWVTAPSSTDWSFGTGNFTVDFWLRKNTSFDSNYRGLCGQYVDSNNYWYFRYKPGTLGIAFFYFKVVEGGVVKADYSTSGLSMSTNTWYHIELVRNGTAIYIFVNGVARSITANTAISTKSMPVFSVLFDVGASHSNGLTFKGYLDEFRVSNGIARHTANFTPPTAPY